MAETSLDGAELAILINRFEGIARKMTNTLYPDRPIRCAQSGAGFFVLHRHPRLQLLATADSLPIHVLVGPDMMARAMKEFTRNSSAATPSFTIRPITAIHMPPTTPSWCRSSTMTAFIASPC